MVISPPESLLGECLPPPEDTSILEKLKARKIDAAATAYARYVLDVRDTFQRCEGQRQATIKWLRETQEAVEKSYE